VRWVALAWVVASLGALAPAAMAASRSDGSVPAPARITQLVTGVPSATLNKVGAGDSRNPISSPEFGISRGDGHLAVDGKPQLLTGLGEINTGTHFCKVAEDPCNLNPLYCFPYTHGLSFMGATYRSPYISFAAIELQDVNGHNLQKPDRHERRSLAAVHLLGVTPAIDIAGAWGFQGSGYDPGTLAHMTWSQIAGTLADPRNRVARQVDGLANLFTAAICSATHGRPGSVCTSSGVRAAVAAVLRKYPSGPPSGPPPGPPPS
jgi:hypothetical protein